ncbi:DUF397 domain-containing protein [Yinghuangia seranimata]|uniref:DUF397 domain-containing protein n=1 Tax=Yinghuangia seranimata TaxID=408067 RepID=UPI00248C19AF|nr:DUF397 domain-containing protein [Yinghuangia seranimata]MDI2126021.1 DUF397 domain-containing protein [Yinghuangia seranimata]
MSDWVKSSHSGDEGGTCVEIAWAKSTHSGDEGGHCVEVAASAPTTLVRDSKRPSGPRLTFSRGAWTDFLGCQTPAR